MAPSELILVLALLSLILISLVGNCLVCLAIFTDRRLRKLGNAFIVSLAIADLFVSCLVMTFALANDLLDRWIFGDWFCDIWISFDIMCCTASILNLCAISLDRFVHIKDCLLYNQWMTRKVAVTGLLIIWFISALVSFLPINLGWHRPGGLDWPAGQLANGSHLAPASSELKPASSEPKPASGEPEPASQCVLHLTPTYAVVSSTISFYIPCIIMLGLYIKLFACARRHARNIQAISKAPAPISRASRSGSQADQSCKGVAARALLKLARPAEPQQLSQLAQLESELLERLVAEQRPSKQQQQQQSSTHKAAMTLGIIMGTFLCCWVPFFCLNIAKAFCQHCIPSSLFRAFTWLGYANSALNPIIYGVHNSEFRHAFNKIFFAHLDIRNSRYFSNRRLSQELRLANQRNSRLRQLKQQQQLQQQQQVHLSQLQQDESQASGQPQCDLISTSPSQPAEPPPASNRKAGGPEYVVCCTQFHK